MKILCALVGSLLFGCIAPVGASNMVTVPRDSAATCARYCVDMGLALSSVVVMANNVGCVCSPASAPASNSAAAATGGMATLELQEQARQQQHH